MARTPKSGANLLLSLNAREKKKGILLLGSNRITANRAFAAMEADFYVVVGGINEEVLQWRDEKRIDLVEFGVSESAGEDQWSSYFESLGESLTKIDLVCLNDTTSGSAVRTKESSRAFYRTAKRYHMLVNIADMPDESDFSWPMAYRFDMDRQDGASEASSLQIAVSTGASACRLGSRLVREIVGSLPANIGRACFQVQELRRYLLSHANVGAVEGSHVAEKQLSSSDAEALRLMDQGLESHMPVNEYVSERLRRVSQATEYWPLERLGSLTLNEMVDSTSSDSSLVTSHGDERKEGRIFLLGAGVGSPLLLTRLAYKLLTTTDPKSPYFVDVILSDKLVPQDVLDLIPEKQKESLVIAKKYPGNADNAQDELMNIAVAAAHNKKTVVRLKQGDPFVYGRGGEEVIHFRANGFEPIVVPGLTSAIAAPTLANIPVTQRGVATTVNLCTGVGRGGAAGVIDPYSRSATLIVLMGVARLEQLIHALKNHEVSPYPGHLPIALLERGTCSDQRIICATLDTIVGVLGQLPEHRAPGMLVIGWSVMCLDDAGYVDVADRDPAQDAAVVSNWLGERGYRLKQGLPAGWPSTL